MNDLVLLAGAIAFLGVIMCIVYVICLIYSDDDEK